MIVTVSSYKGGVAKSTSAIHVAAALGLERPTLLVDRDRHPGALKWYRKGRGWSFEVVAAAEASAELVRRYRQEGNVVDALAAPTPGGARRLRHAVERHPGAHHAGRYCARSARRHDQDTQGRRRALTRAPGRGTAGTKQAENEGARFTQARRRSGPRGGDPARGGVPSCGARWSAREGRLEDHAPRTSGRLSRARRGHSRR